MSGFVPILLSLDAVGITLFTLLTVTKPLTLNIYGIYCSTSNVPKMGCYEI